MRCEIFNPVSPVTTHSREPLSLHRSFSLCHSFNPALSPSVSLSFTLYLSRFITSSSSRSLSLFSLPLSAIRCRARNIRCSALLNARHRPLVTLILWEIREWNNLSFFYSLPLDTFNFYVLRASRTYDTSVGNSSKSLLAPFVEDAMRYFPTLLHEWNRRDKKWRWCRYRLYYHWKHWSTVWIVLS